MLFRSNGPIALPLTAPTAIITLDSPLPDSLVGLNTFYINNPTPLATNIANAVIKFYLPGSNQNLSQTQQIQNYGLGGENYYINYYIQNTDTGDYRKIIAFDMVTRLATLDSATSTDWKTTSGNFAIRREIPVERSSLSSVTSTKEVTLNTTISSSTDYTGYFLRILPLTGVSPGTSQISPYSAPYTEERRITSYNISKIGRAHV